MKLGLAIVLFFGVVLALTAARGSWKGTSGQRTSGLSTSGRWRGRGGQSQNNVNNNAGGNNRRKWNRRQKWGRSNLLQWNRQLSSSVTALERAVANTNRQSVFFVSMDKPNLAQMDIASTLTAYDFKNNLIVMLVLMPEKRMCVSLPTSIVVDFNNTVDMLNARNASQTAVSPTVSIGDFLITGTQKLAELEATNPGAYRLCRHSGMQVVYVVEETDSFTDLSSSTSMSVLTLNGKVTIHTPSTSTDTTTSTPI